MKRWVWLIVGLLVLYLALEGLASSYVLARYSGTPAELVFGDGVEGRRVPVWLPRTMGEAQPPGTAKLDSSRGRLFGHTTTYRLPGNDAVDCWHTPFASFCSTGWSYVFKDEAQG